MKKVLPGMLAALIALCMTQTVVFASNISEAAAMSVEQNQKVTQVVVGFQPWTTYYYTLTMPYDGVMTVTGEITDEVLLEVTGARLLGGGFNERIDMGYNGAESIQHSLREGEWTVAFTVRNRSQYGVDGSFSFSYFVTPAMDIDWQGTPDAEPNDTFADAIELAPDTLVTGNVNARDYLNEANSDKLDFYKFTVLSEAQIELGRKAIDGHCGIWIAEASDDDIAYGGYLGVSDGWKTLSYTLEPGEYKIHVEGHGGTYIGNATGYELSYKVLSGEVSTSAPGSVPSVPDKPSLWAAEQVNEAITNNLVPPFLQSKYTQAVTRSEFCALAVALYESVKGEIDGRKEFTDTTDINVQKCAYIGVVNGTNTEQTVFSPDTPLTREQAATMLSRLSSAIGYDPVLTQEFIEWTDGDDISEYARSAAQFVYKIGVMNGTGANTLVFSPKAPYTREQSIATIVRLFDAL